MEISMYILERLSFQGSESSPQHKWTQYVMCANRDILDKIRSSQHRPEDWRVTHASWLEPILKRSA